MTTKPRIAILIGSTRPGRYADKAAGWMLKQAQARDDMGGMCAALAKHGLVSERNGFFVRRHKSRSSGSNS